MEMTVAVPMNKALGRVLRGFATSPAVKAKLFQASAANKAPSMAEKKIPMVEKSILSGKAGEKLATFPLPEARPNESPATTRASKANILVIVKMFWIKAPFFTLLKL